MVGAIGQPPTAIAALLASRHAPGQNNQDLRRTIGLSHAASVRVIDALSRRNSSSDCRPVTMVARLRSTQPKQDAKQPCARSLPADE
jgi:DNA-binding MarR family transcriptional regulator